MGLNEERRLLALPASELRTFLAMKAIVDRWGEVRASMEELSELTGYSRVTLSKSVQGLEAAGFIEVNRTKRNYGLLSQNRYKILGSKEEFTSDDSGRKADFTTTSGSNSKLTTTSKLVSNNSNLVSNTSYYLVADATKAGKKKLVVNRWSEDDGLASFGSLESDTPAVGEKLSKRSSKNRHLRPQAEWTARDVAAEFAKRLYAAIPNVPALVNTAQLNIILAKYRKEYGTTASFEMQVLEMFFADDRVLQQARKEPHNAWRMFLRGLTTKANRVNENLATATVDTSVSDQYVYASDGREFDNSMPGRAALARYEEKLNVSRETLEG